MCSPTIRYSAVFADMHTIHLFDSSFRQAALLPSYSPTPPVTSSQTFSSWCTSFKIFCSGVYPLPPSVRCNFIPVQTPHPLRQCCNARRAVGTGGALLSMMMMPPEAYPSVSSHLCSTFEWTSTHVCASFVLEFIFYIQSGWRERCAERWKTQVLAHRHNETCLSYLWKNLKWPSTRFVMLKTTGITNRMHQEITCVRFDSKAYCSTHYLMDIIRMHIYR